MHVYGWARRHPGFAMAIKGRPSVGVSQAIAGPTWQDLTIAGKKIKRGVRLWTVGTSMLKLELYGQLQLEKPVDGEEYPPGYVFLPDGTTDEWIKQLVAEQLVSRNLRNGRQRSEWQQVRDRNEALDNAVYARAVTYALQMDSWSDRKWALLIGAVTPKSRRRPRGDADAQPMPPLPTNDSPSSRPGTNAGRGRINPVTGKARGSFLSSRRR